MKVTMASTSEGPKAPPKARAKGVHAQVLLAIGDDIVESLVITGVHLIFAIDGLHNDSLQDLQRP